jgi:hypothetical protein
MSGKKSLSGKKSSVSMMTMKPVVMFPKTLSSLRRVGSQEAGFRSSMTGWGRPGRQYGNVVLWKIW